ncbi:MFS transporter [Pikeienuella sp. HZG-20]|uniref:MFS transporter n=1 Tax=Paludibacillus litoralis TaxID=3133267 RepID=UPI0030EC806C
MRLPIALMDPGYRLFTAGNFFALQGMWAQRTIVAWLAWELSGSAGWVGLIAFFSFAPTLVSGPIFGVLADRSDLRHAVLLTESALALVSAILFLALILDMLTLGALSALALAQGIAISAHNPMRMALTPRLVRRPAIANAIAIGSMNFNLARLSGPAVAGYAIAHFGAPATQGVVALMPLPVIAALFVIRAYPATGTPSPRIGIFASIREGARYVASHPPIRSAMALMATFASVVRGVMELFPVIADGIFERGASGLGALMAAAGAGAFTAALWLATSDSVREREGESPHPPLRTYFALFGGFSAMTLLTVAPTWPAALALVTMIGFCSTIAGVTMQSVVQIAVSDAYRGRVMSLWIMTGIGGASLGSLTMGAAADLFGVGVTLRFTALTGAALIAVLLLLAAHRRRSSRSSASRNLERAAFEKGRPPPP